MEINLTSPALLFPAISLLLLAYTNRFLALASLIRSLHSDYHEQHNERLLRQIGKLRTRVLLIRAMQQLGVGSMLMCVLCMLALFFGQPMIGQVIFAISLILMVLSLIVSLIEIQFSVNALNIHLSDLEQKRDQTPLASEPPG